MGWRLARGVNGADLCELLRKKGEKGARKESKVGKFLEGRSNKFAVGYWSGYEITKKNK